MKNKRIFKDFQASKMSLNIYTSPLLAFVFVFIGEFVAYTFYGISLLALIGLARNFGEAGQNLASYFQNLLASLTDKTSDFRLILELLSFGFILNTVFRWARKVEKRPIRTLGFYRENCLSNLLKGFWSGSGTFSSDLARFNSFGAISFGVHSLESLFVFLCCLYYPILDFTGDNRRSGGPCLAPSSIGLKNQSKTCCSYI